MVWKVEVLNTQVDAEIESLPEDIRARYRRITTLIESYGLERVHEPYVKHLQGKLWEMRMQGKDGIARAIYVAKTGKRVVVLHAFVKKTEKTPLRNLDIALKRAKDVL
jgi:phage-related protein